MVNIIPKIRCISFKEFDLKREILKFKRGSCGCCPGHDTFPDDTYGNRRSKKARTRDRKIENQMVRQLQKRELKGTINEEFQAI